MTVKTGWLHTPPSSEPGGSRKRATGKYAPIALEDSETYRAGAVGAIAIKVETGDFIGAVIVGRPETAKFAARG
jgi:hypothetical protein